MSDSNDLANLLLDVSGLFSRIDAVNNTTKAAILFFIAAKAQEMMEGLKD